MKVLYKNQYRTLRIHLLDVGHGDCTIIEHPNGKITIKDINEGNNKSCIAYIRFLMSERGSKTIHRYIQTHPDMDHMRGLSKLLNDFDILEFWDTRNTKEISSFRSLNEHLDWTAYKNFPEIKKRYYNHDSKNLNLFFEDIEILSPSPAVTLLANLQQSHNNHSYIIRITYGSFSIVLGGDAESEVWDNLAMQGVLKPCTVLKAPHHGRDSGYSLKALQYLKPQHIVTSVGKKPETDAHQKYSYHSQVHSTRHNGNIVLEVDCFGQLNWVFEKNGLDYEKCLRRAHLLEYLRKEQ